MTIDLDSPLGPDPWDRPRRGLSQTNVGLWLALTATATRSLGVIAPLLRFAGLVTLAVGLAAWARVPYPVGARSPARIAFAASIAGCVLTAIGLVAALRDQLDAVLYAAHLASIVEAFLALTFLGSCRAAAQHLHDHVARQVTTVGLVLATLSLVIGLVLLASAPAVGHIVPATIIHALFAGCSVIAMQVVTVRLERTLKALAWDPDEVVF